MSHTERTDPMLTVPNEVINAVKALRLSMTSLEEAIQGGPIKEIIDAAWAHHERAMALLMHLTQQGAKALTAPPRPTP